jgi:hypothetical protein
MDISWPTTESAILFWAELILGWTLCVYVIFGNQPIIEQKLPPRWKLFAVLRAVAMAVSVLLIATWTGWRTVGLVASLSLLALVLPFARVELAERSKPWGAELEVLVNGLAVGVSALLIGDPQTAPRRGLVSVPASAEHLAAVIAIAAIMLFMATGGTHLVRGILARVDAIPRQGGAALDIKEYNRGRVIGIIERIIMTVVVAVGAYAALMFLIGAKGLIRSKELEKHEFAEYFLIGTLASAAIAILFGLLIQALIRTLW